MLRYSARATLKSGKFSTHYGNSINEAVKKAEQKSVTGKAHHGCLLKIGTYGNWQVSRYVDCY